MSTQNSCFSANDVGIIRELTIEQSPRVIIRLAQGGDKMLIKIFKNIFSERDSMLQYLKYQKKNKFLL